MGFAKVVNSSKFYIRLDYKIGVGLILTCQAHPTSESISVDYDDV